MTLLIYYLHQQTITLFFIPFPPPLSLSLPYLKKRGRGKGELCRHKRLNTEKGEKSVIRYPFVSFLCFFVYYVFFLFVHMNNLYYKSNCQHRGDDPLLLFFLAGHFSLEIGGILRYSSVASICKIKINIMDEMNESE